MDAVCVGSSKTKLNRPDGSFLAEISLKPLIHKNAANARSAVSNVFTVVSPQVSKIKYGGIDNPSASADKLQAEYRQSSGSLGGQKLL